MTWNVKSKDATRLLDPIAATNLKQRRHGYSLRP